MTEQEGVIKFDLAFESRPIPHEFSVAALNDWRSVLRRLQLVGQVDGRYEGYGFGNLSQRCEDGFIITGSQTGRLELLNKDHYACVSEFDIEANRLRAFGLSKPSSESLTHALIYALFPSVGCVIHVHSPEIFNSQIAQTFPQTPPEAEYGSAALASAITHLRREGQLTENDVIIMRGHEDGVISFSDSVDNAALRLLNVYTHAVGLSF